MPEVIISKNTRWECQRCGDCCKGKIISKGMNISVQKNGRWVCRYLDEKDKLCTNYEERPFFCRLFPFILGIDAIKKGDKAIPQNALRLENMKIHTECKGYGKGKRVLSNNSIKKEFARLGYDFAINFKKRFENSDDTQLW